jgi:hypothetical protein
MGASAREGQQSLYSSIAAFQQNGASSDNRCSAAVKSWSDKQEQFSHLPIPPTGWIYGLSRSTGDIYYISLSTGETTYDHPSGDPDPSRGSGPGSPSSEFLAVRQWADKQDQFRDRSPPPSGYIYGMSRSTAKVYYINCSTGETMYDHPQSQDVGRSPGAPVHSPVKVSAAKQWVDKQDQFSHLPALPKGWLYGLSKGTGKVYYLNDESGESSYTLPTA